MFCIHITLAADICNGVVSEEFIVDPGSCDHFFYCEDGKNPVLTACPVGMLFNADIHICDLPEHVSCGSSTVNITTTEETNSDLTTVLPNTTTLRPQTTKSTVTTNNLPKSTTAKPTNNVEVECPIGSHDTVQFVSSKTSCREYFICHQGTAFQKECLPELHWNDATKKCDLPEIVKCQLEMIGSSSCPSCGQYVYAHPTKCDQFIYCINGFEIPQKCPFFYHFDVVHRKCMLKTIARCILDNKFT